MADLALPGGSGNIGGDDVGGVPVEGGPGPVIPHGGSRVGVRGGFLHIPQRHPGIEGGGDDDGGVMAQRYGDQRNQCLTNRSP